MAQGIGLGISGVYRIQASYAILRHYRALGGVWAIEALSAKRIMRSARNPHLPCQTTITNSPYPDSKSSWVTSIIGSHLA